MSPLILLAAGKSSRMGIPKGLMRFRGMKMVEYQLSQFAKAGGENVFLVLGTHIDEYYKTFNWPDSKQLKMMGIKLSIILNDRVEWGQFHSIKLGLNQCAGSSVLISPIDAPLPSKELINKLCQESSDAAVPSYKGRRGHPAWLSSSFIEKICMLDSQENRLDQLLVDAKMIECEEHEVVLNLNTIQDLEDESN